MAARRAKRAPKPVVARYDAAGTGRRMRGWMPPSTGPNRAIVGVQKIRDRARDSIRNDWSGAASTQRWVTNLVGIGIVPRTPAVASKARKAKLTRVWREWVARSDADGVLDFYGQQTLAVRAWLESGEVFVRRRKRRLDSGLLVPMQVQLVEADFVPTFDADAWPGMPAGHKIRQGIEFDRSMQRIAYWMHKEHPGDGIASFGATDLIRVSAADVRHVFEPKRPGQIRGVSELAAVLARMRTIGDYDDAVLERQKIANLFVAFITRGLPGIAGDEDFDPLTNLPLDFGDSDLPAVSMEPGIAQELAPGEDVKFANPPEAGTMYHEYMRTQHMGTAAGTGLPYELMSGDIKEVSDRTLRVVINEFRRFAEQRQWQIVIPQMCQPVREWWAQAAVMGGALAIADVADALAVEWAPHGWEYIHPVQDAQGKKVEVEAGFRSRSSVIAERGDDPEDVDDERAVDAARAKRLGLTVDPAAAPPDERPDEDGIDTDEYPK